MSYTMTHKIANYCKAFITFFNPLTYKWKLFRFDQMKVNDFKILIIDVTFYLFQKLIFIVLEG